MRRACDSRERERGVPPPLAERPHFPSATVCGYCERAYFAGYNLQNRAAGMFRTRTSSHQVYNFAGFVKSLVEMNMHMSISQCAHVFVYVRIVFGL